MTIYVFRSNVDSADIRSSQSTPEDFRIPEEIQREMSQARKAWVYQQISYILFGVVVTVGGIWGAGKFNYPPFILAAIVMGLGAIFLTIQLIRRLAIKPRQDTPNAPALNFYPTLLEYPARIPNYAIAYSMLAPVAMKDGAKSVQDFKAAWEKMLDDFLANVYNTFQHETNCSVCSRQGRGFWTEQTWKLDDKYLQSSEDFLRCSKCNSVYCAEHFRALEKGKCKHCGESLRRKHLNILITKPKIKTEFQRGHVTTHTTGMDNVIHLNFSTTGNTSYDVPWRVERGNKTTKLGDKGVINLQFKNTTIKIGENWYLVSGMPGRLELAQNP